MPPPRARILPQGFFKPTTPVDHLTPMGVAAAYLGELVTDELKAMAAEDSADAGKGGKGQSSAAGGGGGGRVGEEPTRIVVVAPQEGQVRRASRSGREVGGRRVEERFGLDPFVALSCAASCMCSRCLFRFRWLEGTCVCVCRPINYLQCTSCVCVCVFVCRRQ